MSEKRNIKRIPVVMDLLFDESLTPEEVNLVIARLSDVVSSSKHRISHGISLTGNKLKETRFMVKDRILIIENFEEKKKSIEEF